MKFSLGKDFSYALRLSDSYFQLLIELEIQSRNNPQLVYYPAGAIIISAACIESYLNELIDIHFSGKENGEVIKKELYAYGTDILKKIAGLKKYAEKPEHLPPDLIESLKLLIQIRGQIAHFIPHFENPDDDDLISKLEKLEKLLDKKFKAEGTVSTERILNPLTAELALTTATNIIKGLYLSGYVPPRPQWLKIVDPLRY